MNASARRLAVLCSTAALATAGAAAGTATAHAAPSHAHHARAGDGRVHMIIDTDIYSDVDDVGALAIANAAQDDGKVDLLGVMVDTPSIWGAPAVDAIDTYYGHGNVPIGSLKPNDDSTWSKNYTQYLAQHFPHSLKSGAGAPDAVRLYRKLLARQPDHSVTIAAIGYENNLAGLLDSGPDRYSALSGYDLVARKVKLLTVMGGNWNFGHVSAPPPSRASVRAAAQRVVNDWPTRLVLNNSPGADVLTGSRLFTETPPTNPVRKAYEIYVGYGNSRNSWDPANVFYDAFATDGMLALTGDVGSDHVYPDGTNAWVASPDKDQNEVVRTASAATFGRALEDLMVQPPRHTPGAGRSSWLALQELRVPPVAAATDDATTLRRPERPGRRAVGVGHDARRARCAHRLRSDRLRGRERGAVRPDAHRLVQRVPGRREPARGNDRIPEPDEPQATDPGARLARRDPAAAGQAARSYPAARGARPQDARLCHRPALSRP